MPRRRADSIETAIAVIGGFGLRAFVLDSRFVPSESMEPTFEVGDLLLLEKVSFRVRPATRGEVVCFRAPPALAKGTPQGACYIKRVVAVGGDEVEVSDGCLFVNGKAVAEPYLRGRISYRLRQLYVPSGHVFVLGDNRDHSYDSHSWGCLPEGLLLGRPLCTFWPLERIRGRRAFNQAPPQPRRFLTERRPTWLSRRVAALQPG